VIYKKATPGEAWFSPAHRNSNPSCYGRGTHMCQWEPSDAPPNWIRMLHLPPPPSLQSTSTHIKQVLLCSILTGICKRRGSITHGGGSRWRHPWLQSEEASRRRHPWERWHPEKASPMAPARRRDQITTRVDQTWIELKHMLSEGR
jgi:hypothetical protein